MAQDFQGRAASHPGPAAVEPGSDETTLSEATVRASETDTPDPERDVLRVGTRLRQYKILAVLGKGGMGVVYEALDLSLERIVALKVLRSDHSYSQARLIREARTLAALDLPNVVRVYEVGHTGDEAYIAMELVSGTDLKDWVAAPGRTSREILIAYTDLAVALHRCHQTGVVHRDIKPSNVRVASSGRIVLMDFGIAGSQRTDTPSDVTTPQTPATAPRGPVLTQTGDVLGTPGYMSPEQRCGGAADPKSDQYAFAISLFEALCGWRPPVHTRDRPIVVPASAKIPSWAARIVERGLEPDPARRWQSMGDLADALRHGLARKRRILQATAVVMVASAAVGAWGVSVYYQHLRCAEAGNEATALWTTDLRTRLEARYPNHRSDAGGNVLERLDAYVADWAASAEQLCEAELEHRLPEGSYATGTACLRTGLTTLDRMLEVFEQPDAPTPPVANGLVSQLRAPASCLELQPVDGAVSTSTNSTTNDDSSAAVPCAGRKYVQFVYFVERDQRYVDRRRRAIERQAWALQQLWYDSFGGTFRLADPVVEVVLARHESSWYVETPDGAHQNLVWYRMGNMKNEVFMTLGLGETNADVRVVAYPESRHDGLTGAHFGVWLDGDDISCIDGDEPTHPFASRDEAHCLAHLAHLYGLVSHLQPGVGPIDSCMNRGFYLKHLTGTFCRFTPDDVAVIIKGPENVGWVDARPLDSCADVERAVDSPGDTQP